MSDTGRQICGCLLLILSLFLLLAGFLPFHSAERAAFDAGEKDGIPPLHPTELLSGTDLLNQGTPEELTELPGIGPFLADEIIRERTSHGPFWYPEDITNVKGIGIKKMEQIRQILLTKEDESED